MEVELTIRGVELSIKNSLRLLEDALSPGLSLPTAGALSELGLEEAAKGFLILICLEKSGKLSKKSSLGLDSSLSDLVVGIEEYIKEIECQNKLHSAFKKHLTKTEILNVLGSLFKGNLTESFTIQKYVKDYIKNIKPGMTDDYLNNILDQPEVMDLVRKNITETREMLKGISGDIKKSGFYVDWTGSDYSYPEVDKNTVLNMLRFLISSVAALVEITEIYQLRLQIQVDVIGLTRKLDILNEQLK